MQYKTSDVLIGSKLKELRKAKGLSTYDVCKLMKCSSVTITHYEQGRNAINIPNLKRICNIYGVDMLEFLQEIYEQL